MAMVSDTDSVVRGALCRTGGARLRCVLTKILNC
jgi:hypothetical protein